MRREFNPMPDFSITYKSYGRHYKYVVRDVDASLLRSKEFLSCFLKDLCVRIKMRPLGDVIVFDVEEEISKIADVQEDEGGVSVILGLSTSHIAAHGWPMRGLLIMDVFSCRDFNGDDVELFIYDRLKTDKVLSTDVSGSMRCVHGEDGPVDVEEFLDKSYSTPDSVWNKVRRKYANVLMETLPIEMLLSFVGRHVDPALIYTANRLVAGVKNLENVSPDEICSMSVLDAWALRNGYAKMPNEKMPITMEVQDE